MLPSGDKRRKAGIRTPWHRAKQRKQAILQIVWDALQIEQFFLSFNIFWISNGHKTLLWSLLIMQKHVTIYFEEM